MSIKKTRLIGIVAIAMVLSIAFSAAPTATAWPPNLPPYERCLALVIGISDYEGEVNDDPSGASVRDARYFYWDLYDYWGMFQSLTLLVDQEATESGIDTAFASTFAGAGPNDLAIVFVSANGGQNSFGTYDSQPYTAAKLAQKLSEINAEAKIVIIDACHARSFADELNVDGQVSIMSCQSEEYAWVFKYYTSRFPYTPLWLTESAFSHYLNEHPDINGDGVITIEEVFGYASPHAMADAAEHNHSQQPIMVDNIPGDVAYLGMAG